MRSSNTNGASVNYSWDDLNRLSVARDLRLVSGGTGHSYDLVGNQTQVLTPNGIRTNPVYDTLNRITSQPITNLSQPPVTLASFAYPLEPAGHRVSVLEATGRAVNYGYDAQYKLLSEAVAGTANSGTVGYTYDPVGNRLSRTSSLAAVPAATYGYDANDRLSADTYD